MLKSIVEAQGAEVALAGTLDGKPFAPAPVSALGEGRYLVRDVPATGGLLTVQLDRGDGFPADDSDGRKSEDHREPRSAIDPGVTSHRGNDRSHQGQPQAVAGGGPGVLDPHEPAEQRAGVCNRRAWSVVPHGDARSPAAGFADKPHQRSCRRMAQGIVEQIGHGLTEEPLIPVDNGARACIDFEAMSVRLEIGRVGFTHLLHQGRQVHWLSPG